MKQEQNKTTKWRSDKGRFLGGCVSPNIPLSPHSFGLTDTVLIKSLLTMKFWVSRGDERGGEKRPNELASGFGGQSKAGTFPPRSSSRANIRYSRPATSTRNFFLPHPPPRRGPLPLEESRPPRYQATGCQKQLSRMPGVREVGWEESLSNRNEPR